MAMHGWIDRVKAVAAVTQGRDATALNKSPHSDILQYRLLVTFTESAPWPIQFISCDVREEAAKMLYHIDYFFSKSHYSHLQRS